MSNANGITVTEHMHYYARPAVARMAKSMGAERVSFTFPIALCDLAEQSLKTVVQTAALAMDGRKTLRPEDVEFAIGSSPHYHAGGDDILKRCTDKRTYDCFYIAKAPFERTIRFLAQPALGDPVFRFLAQPTFDDPASDDNKEIRLSSKAVNILRAFTEELMKTLILHCINASRHAGRVTLTEDDVALVKTTRRDCDGDKRKIGFSNKYEKKMYQE